MAEFLVPISLFDYVLWPFWSFRFVLPLTPFLYLVFCEGLGQGRRRAAHCVLVVISLNLYDHAGYLLRGAVGTREDVDWIAQLPGARYDTRLDEDVISTRPRSWRRPIRHGAPADGS